MKNTQELPKWFTNSGGICYKKGDKVTNFLSNQSIDLTEAELSMYDYIKGAELIAYQSTTKKFKKTLIKPLVGSEKTILKHIWCC